METRHGPGGEGVCRVCGATNPPERLFCAGCGTYLQSDQEDTWVDLPPRRPSVADPARSAQSRWVDDRSAAPDPPPPASPPPRRRWLLASVLALALLAALTLAGFIIYRTLYPGDDSGSDPSATSTTAGPGDTTTTDTSPPDPSTSTTQGGSSTRLLPVSAWSASSTLPPASGNTYDAANLLDADLGTCWSEGVEGQGVEEWVRLDLEAPVVLTTIEIANGYQKDDRRFLGNPRVARIRIEYSTGSSQMVQLHDALGFQSVTPPPTPTAWVRFVIESTYEGETWQDTSLSEIRLYGPE